MNLLSILLAISVTAQLDSTQLMLGDQCTLRLQAVCESDEHVQFPVYGEELMQGIEITERTGIDTLRHKDGRQTLSQQLTITSFTDSLFYIEPIVFTSGEDTFRTEALALNVIQPFEIDSTEYAITDIKPVFKAPIWWWGILRWVLLALGMVGFGIGAWYLARYLRKRKAGTEEAESTEELRPAEEVAIEKLDKIKAAKLWQQGRQKEYHTELTDVIREYIERRFEVSSQEKTSEEILDAMKPLLADQKELFGALKRMLGLADLVKFARWNALAEENEASLHTAYTFVRETTPSASPTEEETTQNEVK